jgi:hypothetical protein
MVSLSTYCLDVLVEGAALADGWRSIATPVFISVRADGVPRAAWTSPVAIAPNLTWREPFRLVLRLPGLDGFSLIASLRAQTGAVVVAGGRLPLASLPFGRPARIVFPLQSASDAAVELAKLTIAAAISPIMSPSDAAGRPPSGRNPYEGRWGN